MASCMISNTSRQRSTIAFNLWYILGILYIELNIHIYTHDENYPKYFEGNHLYIGLFYFCCPNFCFVRLANRKSNLGFRISYEHTQCVCILDSFLGRWYNRHTSSSRIVQLFGNGINNFDCSNMNL